VLPSCKVLCTDSITRAAFSKSRKRCVGWKA
jgi:hypothetical protein